MRKKNFRKVPNFIWEKLKNENPCDVVVGCSKQHEREAIIAGTWSHVGLRADGGILQGSAGILPGPENGRYSRRNVHGHVIVRKDLPKVSKAFYLEAPSGRDGCGGTHTIVYYRSVYRRDFRAPQELTISSEILAENDSSVVVKFTVDRCLERKSADFEEQLLFALNLLQENVGGANIFAPDASTADYLGTVHVDWELLPQGSDASMMGRLLQGVRRNVEMVKARIEARKRLLEGFQPAAWVVGTSGLRRYFGAKFREDLAVFENIEYGNAMYILFGNWSELSRLSRIELMERTSDVVRIVHRSGWEEKLKRVLADHIRPINDQQAA